MLIFILVVVALLLLLSLLFVESFVMLLMPPGASFEAEVEDDDADVVCVEDADEEEDEADEADAVDAIFDLVNSVFNFPFTISFAMVILDRSTLPIFLSAMDPVPAAVEGGVLVMLPAPSILLDILSLVGVEGWITSSVLVDDEWATSPESLVLIVVVVVVVGMVIGVGRKLSCVPAGHQFLGHTN